MSYLLVAAACMGAIAADPPLEWIEPATGHRVVRLSREAGTSSFYFHQNGYTAEGDKLVVTVADGLATIDLTTREIKRIVELLNAVEFPRIPVLAKRSTQRRRDAENSSCSASLRCNVSESRKSREDF